MGRMPSKVLTWLPSPERRSVCIMANAITGLRILVSMGLLLSPVFSPIFYGLTPSGGVYSEIFYFTTLMK